VASGVRIYDVMSRVGASGGLMPKPKSLSKEELGALAPDLNLDEVTGGVTYYDAQIDDARHTVAVARTAASYGAALVTRTEVVALLRVTIEGDDHVNGVRVKDVLTDETYDIYARVVISAVGVWTDSVRALLGGPPAAEVRQSKGVHLVIPRDAFRSSTAVIARTPASVLFLLPWGRNWLVGTTDTDWQGDLANPAAEESDIDYLIGQANRWLTRPLRREDVVGVYAGLRPLVSDGNADDATTTLSREHAIFRPVPGLVQIAGGKYTTYRVMAADVVDAAVTDLISQGHSSVRESRTADIPLVGAAGYETDWAARVQIAEEAGLSVEAVESLLHRHGGRVNEVFDLLDDPALAEPLVEGEPYLRAEIVHAGTHEAALAVEDVLIRRTRIALETRDGAKSAAVDAAELLGRALGWSPAEAERAAATYQ
jgi:glycerol-3-phosphate dehydrogenase